MLYYCCFSIGRCAKFVGHVRCLTVISHPALYKRDGGGGGGGGVLTMLA